MKGQVSKVFLVPAIVGTAVIAAFYLMIMYFNDNRFTPGEFAGMGTCAAVVAALSLVLYGVYRFTRGSVCRSLGISPLDAEGLLRCCLRGPRQAAAAPRAAYFAQQATASRRKRAQPGTALS